MMKIKEYRLKSNLTQQELADKIGISKSYISELENNLKYPSVKILIHLSVILNVTTDELLGLKAYRDIKSVTKIICYMFLFDISYRLLKSPLFNIWKEV